MSPEHSEKDDSHGASPTGRIIRRGMVLYLLGIVAVPLVCYFFGWQSLEAYGTGYLWGGLVTALFGLFTAAGNSLPFQLHGTRPAVDESGLKREGSRANAGPARQGFRFFMTTLIAGALLGITGVCLHLPW